MNKGIKSYRKINLGYKSVLSLFKEHFYTNRSPKTGKNNKGLLSEFFLYELIFNHKIHKKGEIYTNLTMSENG